MADRHNQIRGSMGKAEQNKSLVRISKAAEAAEVSRQTVQYYLMLGLIEASGHSTGGQQLFDQKVIERIRLIKQLNDSGYPLREIRETFLRNR